MLLKMTSKVKIQLIVALKKKIQVVVKQKGMRFKCFTLALSFFKHPLWHIKISNVRIKDRLKPT